MQRIEDSIAVFSSTFGICLESAIICQELLLGGDRGCDLYQAAEPQKEGQPERAAMQHNQRHLPFIFVDKMFDSSI